MQKSVRPKKLHLCGLMNDFTMVPATGCVQPKEVLNGLWNVLIEIDLKYKMSRYGCQKTGFFPLLTHFGPVWVARYQMYLTLLEL